MSFGEIGKSKRIKVEKHTYLLLVVAMEEALQVLEEKVEDWSRDHDYRVCLFHSMQSSTCRC
jgi:hypothetical protein